MLVKFEPYQARNVLCKVKDKSDTNGTIYTLNPYRGCAVGCRYCYVQLKKHKDSSGFEAEKDHIVQVKINAPFLLKEKMLQKFDPAMIIIGESCEPYADIEDKYFITQRLLEVLKEYSFQIHIMTRYSRILRDINLILDINRKNRVHISISMPVVSGSLAAKLEGNSPSVKERLKTIKALKRYNIDVGIAVAPVIPYISDGDELSRILKRSAEAGAVYVFFRPLIIKKYQKEMFFSWLEEKYPDLLTKYEELYCRSEVPSNEYWKEFIEIAEEKAVKSGLRIGVENGIKK